MVGVAVMLIMMTVAAQSWTFRIRREMEAELIFRGEQYVQGLQRYREATGGFPLGDLKVLVNKTPEGVRFMRKLYRNPFHEKGEWQYLYLHPGGSGFINPCAKLTAPAAFAASGQLPIAGMQMMGGDVAGGDLEAAGTSRRGGRGRGTSMFGDRSAGGGDPTSQLSAMDPEAFKASGISGMNLPIVGVVNCEQVESIRTYQAQTWMANWAFTPLAQGEFGGKAMGGGSGQHNVRSGLGLFGAQSYSTRDGGSVPGRFIGLDDDNRPEPGRHRRRGGESTPPQQGAGDDEVGEDDQDRPAYQWRRDPGAGDEDRADDRDEEASEEETPRQRRRGRGTPAKTDPNDKSDDDDGESDEEQDPNFIDEDGDGEEDSSEDDDGEGDGEEDDDGESDEDDDGPIP